MKYLLVLLFSINTAFAGCLNLYPYNKPIKIEGTTEYCNSFYVSLYNEDTKSLILTSEILKPNGHGVERSNIFRVDQRSKSKVNTGDYSNSGYDRGHMVPAGDSTTDKEMRDTFLMTNITPQEPKLNRLSWKVMEEEVRKRVQDSGKPKHVVTGAIYKTNTEMNGIPVPSAYYKIVYFKKPLVYYAENKPLAKTEMISIEKLQMLK